MPAATRLQTVRKFYGHLPPWRCVSYKRGVFYLCGHCFGLRGSGPATNTEEVWKPGTDEQGKWHHDVVPKGAACEQCGGRAWPSEW